MSRGGLQVGGNFRGDWDTDVEYLAGDLVLINGSLTPVKVNHVSTGSSPDLTKFLTSVGGSGGAPQFAVPWVASTAVNAGDIKSQAGALYTATATFTTPASFNTTGFATGAPSGTIYEQNGSGQVIAIWKGNGTGNAATKVMDVATGGVIIAGAWSAGATYSADTYVTRPGPNGLISFVAIQSSTGQDPLTDTTGGTTNGTYWMVLAAPGPKGDTGATGTGVSDQGVLARHLADTARDYELPTGYVAQSVRRSQATATVTAPVSGTLQFTTAFVPGGRTITDIAIYSATVGAATPTNQWFAIYDVATRTKIAVTADDTTTAWATNTLKTLTLSAPWTPTNGTLVYVGICVVAATVPTLTGTAQPNAGSIAPTLAGASTASLTNPASAPTTAAALTAKAPFWAGLKGT